MRLDNGRKCVICGKDVPIDMTQLILDLEDNLSCCPSHEGSREYYRWIIKHQGQKIEALQQENEQLKDENASLRNWNACEEKLHNELLESDKRRRELELELEDANNYRAGLEAIVDKLRAQVAAMKTAICNMCRGKECDNCAFGDANITETIKHWRPERVCLCGSTRFFRAFDDWNFRFTLEGKIVLTIGCNTKSDKGLGLTDEDKIKLDELHKRKIDLADWIFVIDVGGYIGSSTQSEIEYAQLHGKPIKYLSKEFPDYQEPAGYHNPADVEAMRKHIEALQQENEQLQAQLDEWKYEAKCHMDEVVARNKEIERLEAQVDTLSATVNMLAPDEIGKECRHIEALRKAREALEMIFKKHINVANHDKYPKTWRICSEAIAEIDKVIGGKEDA